VKYVATGGEAAQAVDHVVDVDRPGEVTVDGTVHAVDLRSIDDMHLYSLIVDDASYEMHVERHMGVYYVQIGGDRYAVEVEQERLKKLRAMGGRRHEEHGGATVRAPMPGLVVRVFVEPGQPVAIDQSLVILEAMKMENEIRSPRAGVVKSVAASPGAAVNKDDELLAIVDAPDAPDAGPPGASDGPGAAS
jgi:biotin carboxyl carrier protein